VRKDYRAADIDWLRYVKSIDWIDEAHVIARNSQTEPTLQDAFGWSKNNLGSLEQIHTGACSASISQKFMDLIFMLANSKTG